MWRIYGFLEYVAGLVFIFAAVSFFAGGLPNTDPNYSFLGLWTDIWRDLVYPLAEHSPIGALTDLDPVNGSSLFDGIAALVAAALAVVFYLRKESAKQRAVNKMSAGTDAIRRTIGRP